MKLKTFVKRATALVLSITLTVVALPMTRLTSQAADETDETEGFDEGNIVLRLGVLSDLHLSYTDTDNAGTIKTRISNYVKAAARLNQMAENQLDALLLCGDYTGEGSRVQGEIFTSASKAVMDAINVGKEESEKAKFLMAYGNHDTLWSGCMSYEDWESLMNQYGLLNDVEAGPENSGSYKMTITKNGKTYTFFSVETETYNNPSNTFRKDVLDWLDAGLNAAVTENPNNYVYVVSHGPIKESGVYGSNIAFEKNADWATAEAGFDKTITRGDGTSYEVSSDIHGVLEKYPQVMYFSGHTHLTNVLESTIMSHKYTALTVSALHSGDWFSNVCDYLDGKNEDIGYKSGYAIYIEVDQNGKQRIRRIQNPFSGIEDTMVSITYKTDTDKVVVDSVTINSITGDATELTPWYMDAPQTDKSHLTKYSAAKRMKNPEFAGDASVTIDIANSYKSSTAFSTDVTFDAATFDNTIIRYDISLLDSEQNVIGTRWALGNWIPSTTGVADGTTHLDATKFQYNSVMFSNVDDVQGCSIRVTAYDEFGGSASITSEPITEEPKSLLEEPVKRLVYDEMFNVTTGHAVASSNQDGVTFTYDEDGKLEKTTIDTTGGYRNAVFMTSPSKYESLVTNTETNAPFNGWAYPGTYPQNLTDFDADDTFVYEADFSAGEGTADVYIHFRTPEMDETVAAWKTDYTGLRIISGNGVYATICDEGKLLSKQFQWNDTELHHIKIVSSPTLLSVWIDDIAICENYPFNPQTWKDTKYAECFATTQMIPTMAYHVKKGGTLTVTNQTMYYYDPADETEKYVKADDLAEENMFDGMTKDRAFPLSNNSNVNITLDANGVITAETSLVGTTEPWTNLCFVTSADKFAQYKGSYGWGSPGTKPEQFTDLEADDTFVYEADFSKVNGEGTVYFHIRTPKLSTDTKIGWQTDYTGVALNSSGVSLYVVQKEIVRSTSFKLTDTEMHHIKIVSKPTTVTVLIDGKEIFTDQEFTAQEVITGEGIYVESNFAEPKQMIPTMAIFINNLDIKVTNQSLRRVPVMTKYTSNGQNLLNRDFAKLYTPSSKYSGSYTEGNNFYSNMRYDNLSVGRFAQDRLYFFDNENKNWTPEKEESYLLSGLLTATNASLNDGTNTYPSRMTTYFGSYNGDDMFAFVQNTSFCFYHGQKLLREIDLAAKYGYAIGDTVRISALLSPFGLKYYFDGVKIYEFTFDNSNLLDYTGLSLGIGGTLGAWRDIVFMENVDNGTEYKDCIPEKVEKLNATQGVYYTEEDKTIMNEALEACEAHTGTANDSLVPFVNKINQIFVNRKVVNNLVLEGKTSAPEDKKYEFTQTYEHYGIQLLKNGETPFTRTDSWQVDFDLDIESIGDSNVRLIFAVDGNSDINLSKLVAMVQDNGCLFGANTTGTKVSWSNAANNASTQGKTLHAAGTSWHFTYIVTPAEDGATSVRTLVQSKDRSATYMDFTCTDTVTAFNPYIYYRTANIYMRNLCISYDLTSDFAKLNEAGTSVDTTGMALVSVNRFNDAYAMRTTILDTPAKYGRTEIRNAVSSIENAANLLVKYGNLNGDKKTDSKDIVRMKRYLSNPEVVEANMDAADVDADGNVNETDTKLLREYIAKQ